MGSPPTALDSLVQLRARETRVRRLPPAYSLSSTSICFFERWPKIHLRYCRIRRQPQPKGWETMDPDEATQKFDESFFWAVGIIFYFVVSFHKFFRIWTPATQTWKQGQLFQKRQNIQRKTFGTLI